QLAGIVVERDYAVGVEVVAGAEFGVEIGSRIARAPVLHVELGIVRAGRPDRAAAAVPGVVAVLPGLVAGLTLGRNGVELPLLLARSQVGRGNEAADAIFGTGNTGHGLVLGDQRRHRDGLGDRWIGNLLLPSGRARLLVDGEHAAVERGGDDL